MKYATREDIISSVRILDIASDFSIKVEPVSSGNFDYRCRCPSSNHKNGGERTGSCYIDSKRNNFFCFGCNTGVNCLDFYMLCSQCNFSEAILSLREKAKISGKITAVETNNFPILLETSKKFRELMINHKDDLKWINEFMKKVDEYILNIDSKDEALAKKILNNVNKKIKERYGDS